LANPAACPYTNRHPFLGRYRGGDGKGGKEKKGQGDEKEGDRRGN